MNRRVAGRIFYFVAKVFTIDNDRIAAFRAQFINQFVAANDVHGLVAQLSRDLNHCAACCGIRGILDEPISFFQIDIILE